MFIEISRGRSFKGLAQYCLHDVGAKSKERVAFVEARNLGTSNPNVAWRIMAARHYLQDELKAKAGVGRGGAKDGKPVGHLLISWKREEAEAQQLNRLGMLNTAYGALRAIGANDHQAIIIGHTDTDHPHCHIIVNLIGEDGRLKKNWKEREKLSKFALAREKEIHGEAIVKTREKNWLDREAGESPAPVKKKARHLYELDKAAQQCPATKEFAEEHRRKLAQIEQARKTLAWRQKKNHERLLACHKERLRRLAIRKEAELRANKSAVRIAYRENWHKLLCDQEAKRSEFEANEKNLKGSVANAMSLIDWKQMLRWRKQPEQLGLSDAFRILTSEAVRRKQIKLRQEREQELLRTQQRKVERENEQALALTLRNEEHVLGRLHSRKALAMRLRQARRTELLRAKQQGLTKERNEALKVFRELRQEQRRDRLVELRILTKQRSNDSAHESSKENTPDLSPSTSAETERPRRVRGPRKERMPRSPRNSSKPQLDAASEKEGRSAIGGQVDDFEARMQKRIHDRATGREWGGADQER